MTEKEKMLAGDWYDANYNPDLLKERIRAMDLCFDLNQTRPSLINQRNDILKQLFSDLPEELVLLSPFTCDYGFNVHIGKSVFVNANCYFMDCASITIGDHCFIGPSCGFYTAHHPLDYKTRNSGLEKALPIVVGDSVWFGANVSVMPGVKIGNGCVIAAGSVVTKDVEDNCLVAGVPAKVVKKIEQK